MWAPQLAPPPPPPPPLPPPPPPPVAASVAETAAAGLVLAASASDGPGARRASPPSAGSGTPQQKAGGVRCTGDGGGAGVNHGHGLSTHEGIAPPARRQVKSPARAALRLRSSTIQPLPLQKTVQPLSARRMARSSCDYSEQKETSLRTRRERWAEAWLGWMPGWAWAAVWTRMVTVRACAAAAGGAGQSAAGSPACRSRRVCQAPRCRALTRRREHENSCPFSARDLVGGSQTASQSPSACHSQLINQFSAITCRARAARQTDEPLLDRSTRGRPTDHRQAHVSASDSYGGSRQVPGRAAPTPSTIDADRPSRRS